MRNPMTSRRRFVGMFAGVLATRAMPLTVAPPAPLPVDSKPARESGVREGGDQ
jgi:hypothetical protein